MNEVSPQPQTRPRQKLWPLFVLAGALGVFGFYFAFKAPAESAQGRAGGDLGSFSTEVALPEELDRSLREPEAFVVKPRPRAFPIALEHVVRRTAGQESTRPLTTRIALTVEDTYEKTVGTSHVFERSYRDAVLSIHEREVPVGRGITGEVQRLLGAARHRIVVEPHGRIADYILTSSEAAQLRQTLDIVQDSLSILSPQFPREAINVGESWSYQLPGVARLDGETDLTLDTALTFTNTLEGFTRRDDVELAVVRQTIDYEATGSIETSEDEALPSASLVSRGRGSGVFYFDLEKGQVVEAEVRFEETTRFDESPFQLEKTVVLQIPQH